VRPKKRGKSGCEKMAEIFPAKRECGG
jgi:hypothetical protein